MGRHRKPDAVVPGPQRVDRVDEVPGAASPRTTVDWRDLVRAWPQPVGGHEAASIRRAQLQRRQYRLAGAFAEEALAAAIEIQVRVAPPRDVKNDRGAVRIVAAHLADHALGIGRLDVETALTVDEVGRYLARRKAAGARPSTVKAHQYALHRAVRVVHPQARVGRREAATTRSPRIAPVSHEHVRELYRITRQISATHGQTMLTILDLATGAGARASEMRRVTGADVTTVRPVDSGMPVTVVRLVNSRGAERHVPVLDAEKAQRLTDLAARVGTAPLLPRERNSVNRVRENLRRQGKMVEFNAAALRYRWLIDLTATPMPAAALMQIADAYRTDEMHELRGWIGRYDIHQVIGLSRMWPMGGAA